MSLVKITAFEMHAFSDLKEATNPPLSLPLPLFSLLEQQVLKEVDQAWEKVADSSKKLAAKVVA